MADMKIVYSKKATPQKSQAIQAGPHIFVSGQIPADAEGKLTEGSIADKTKACCEGVKYILEEAGSSIAKVVKVRLALSNFYCLHQGALSCGVTSSLRRTEVIDSSKRMRDDGRTNDTQTTVFITTMDNFAEMNSVYEQYFTHKPARSCVAVKELPKGVPVEIECIALS
ncbi:hypothetical protein LTR91_005693 [Friedmanniomyces endolithicus]|uniref:Uncharacterized protein n=1 Tax=Friedmanniomyces endolithicus TaxID=329885 RepID=A0AAN6J6B5_9PEZI|nr:hypothetical protein LTR01_005217 [Friedmanniomyces endolithicus]KAK0317813.1 hypothetical protein LTR82_011074 [Friedmanniomyces endolithicus]KAK0831760.1 hypothetical protein LTR73_003143 [Friedmanniomyces endolithicus]KAK0919432.1 hypothetical protein LTR57_010815 [Friedmanniomyces endolithicus]KAK1000249.1 hypothetical protein LTR91_005693 [Friedmanniomyces endolithicus]